mmetsp:Transcript_9178/g.11461  ORF Transcript_9178/g.11461 Transcript_9178/m.11461 type:complete len:90 (+) Transcript_9178:81-350(+)
MLIHRVEDHGCLFSHCFYDCVLNLDSWLNMIAKTWNGHNEKGTQNSCLDCMERRCSKAYIDSCGANRRTAGVISELDRDSREICKDVDI